MEALDVHRTETAKLSEYGRQPGKNVRSVFGLLFTSNSLLVP